MICIYTDTYKQNTHAPSHSVDRMAAYETTSNYNYSSIIAPVCEQTSETIWALVALLTTVIVGDIIAQFRKIERNAQ